MVFRLPPSITRWVLRDVRVPAASLAGAPASDREGLAAADLVVAGTVLESVGPAGTAPVDLPALAGAGRLLLPCFVDVHTHLDKGHIAPRAENIDGTFPSALAAVARDRAAHWSAEDVRDRMEFALRCAYAHGTAAIRTHLDSLGPQTRISWPVFAELRDAWAGRIRLEASPLFGIDVALDDAHMADVTAMVGAFGHVLGAVTYPVPQLQAGLDRLFTIASDRGFDLDFHVDETGDPTVNTLKVIAETALRFKFPGRILAGHCCALAVAESDERQRTIDLVAEAGIAVVSLPMCNMYLQSRDPTQRTTPRWRGVTAFKELAQAGVPVMVASDNTRDPFYAYGDLDMAEVWREATRILHLDHPFGRWSRTVAATPADIIGITGGGRIVAGGAADLVLFEARSLSEFMARPRAGRTIIRAGRPIEAELPAYAELDHLRGLLR